MHGGFAVTKKNPRRTGVPATIKGKPNPNYHKHLPKDRQDIATVVTWEQAEFLQRVAISKEPEVILPAERQPTDGPTKLRIAKAEGSFTIGDDKQGTRVYHFHDAPLERLYSRLGRQAKGRGEEETVRAEYAALMKYRVHWHNGGLEIPIGSVDLNRIFASDPSSMSGMAKTERQAHHRRQYREARELLGWKPHIVVENVICAETSLEVAGWSIGYNSPFRAREGAEKILREAARKLAKHWGIN